MSIPDSVLKILTTSLIDLILSSIIFGLFLFYRKTRSIPPYTEITDPSLDLKLPIYNESEYSFVSISKLIYKIPINHIQDKIGQLGGLFLQLNLYLFYLSTKINIFLFCLQCWNSRSR